MADFVRHTLLVIAVLLLCVLSYRVLWGQSRAEPPASQIFLPLVVSGVAMEATSIATDSDDATLANVAPTTEYFPDESEAMLDPDQLVQRSSTNDWPGYPIDASEDYRTLGYPDGRKLVRNSQEWLYVTYRKKWNGRYRIFVAQSSDSGSQWTILNSGQPVEEVGNYNQRAPVLGIDHQDRLHLLWYGNDASNTNETNDSNEREIKYTRSISTATGLQWEPWRNLYDGSAYTTTKTLWQEHPALYVRDSNVYVVWESNEGVRAHIKFLRSTDYGATWSSVIVIRPSATVHFSRPTLLVSAVGAKNYLYLFAYGTENGISQLYWSRSLNNGNSWSAWRTVAAGPTDQRHVTVARDAQERLHVVWRQVANGRTILRYRVYDPALNSGRGAWVAAPKTIAAIARRCLFFPSITVTSTNEVWVVWTQSADCNSVPKDDPKDGQIFYRYQTADGVWSSPTALTTVGKHLYATLRRIDSPTAPSDSIDVVWLDGSNSTLDELGNVICPPGACIIRLATLNEEGE